MAGTTEICGNTTANDAVAELELGKFTVFFRSSEMLSFKGFEMYIICFRPDERNLPGTGLLSNDTHINISPQVV